MKFDIIILILSFRISVVELRVWNVLWERDFCSQALPDTFIYPFNTNCSLCTSDQLRLHTPNIGNYENVYRVETEQEMLACNATNALNTSPLIFNTETVFTLINSGSSDNAFNFYLGQWIYLISTSNGTKHSARNDVTRPVNSCLQFSFVLLTFGQNCGNFDTTCSMTSVFTDNSSRIGCESAIISEIVTELNSTENSTNSTTKYHTNNYTISSPFMLKTVLRSSIAFISIGIFIFLFILTCFILSLIITYRVVKCNKSKRLLQIHYQLEQNNLDGEDKESRRNSFEFVEPV